MKVLWFVGGVAAGYGIKWFLSLAPKPQPRVVYIGSVADLLAGVLERASRQVGIEDAEKAAGSIKGES